VLGAVVSTYWHNEEKKRDETAREAEKQELVLRQVRDRVSSSIAERTEAADTLIQGLEDKLPPPDIDRLWQRYETACHDQDVAYENNQLNLEGISDVDLVAETPLTTVFWNYLDLVIQPRFRNLNTCITKLYIKYQEPRSTRATLVRSFDECDKEDLLDNASKPTPNYWDRYHGSGSGVQRWYNFKTCLHDYSYLLDWHVRIQSRVWAYARSADELRSEWYTRWPWQHFQEPRSYDDPMCWQQRLLFNLKDNLENVCGIFPIDSETLSPKVDDRVDPECKESLHAANKVVQSR